MSAKWVIFVCFIFIFSSFLFSLRITWYDQNGYEITKPDKNDDSKYWTDAMANAMRDPFTGCCQRIGEMEQKTFIIQIGK